MMLISRFRTFERDFLCSLDFDVYVGEREYREIVNALLLC
jgi:hypothetical protein